MKVYFNNSCKICRSEINLYKKENIKDIDWIDITNNSDAEKETSRNDKELLRRLHVKGDIGLSLNVTAKNISTGRGGAFANEVINVARRGGPNAITSQMITGLVKDSFTDMEKKFIPQVIQQMSTISVGGNPLIAYELVLKDFTSKEVRSLRTKLKQVESDDFRYISFDNSVPTIVTIVVRHAGKTEDLGDKIMEILDTKGINTNEPIIAPDLTDLC